VKKLIGVTLGLLLPCFAMAQVVGLGTTQVGSTSQLSIGIAKIVSDKSTVQMRTQPMAGAAQYAPLVNAGDIEFGVANIVELHYLIDGKVLVEGRKNPDLRMVARLVPWYVSLVVKGDSPIHSFKDLKGQPLAYGFSGNPLGRAITDGFLANGGLTAADIKPVLVPSFPRMFAAFKQQQSVASITTVGSSQPKEWEAAFGRVRFLPVDDSPHALAALQKFLPHSYVVTYKPTPGITGIDEPTKILVYDYTLFAGSKVKDEVVAKVLEALYANPQALKDTSKLWSQFDPREMSKDLGVPYHPGAIKFYQAKGMWPGKK
jgi:TRAP transporter TAXI family solute receptor